MELLKNIRAYEDVYFEDPEENPDTPRFRVWFDDKHIEEYLAKVGNAIDRAQANEQMAREADTPEKAAEANAAQVRLMKRTVSTFIGTEGWEQLLAWMGGKDGPIVPEENIRILGEVFATFLNMLGRYATSEQLMACGLMYNERAEQVQALNRAQRRAKGKRKKSGKYCCPPRSRPSGCGCRTGPAPRATHGTARTCWCATTRSRSSALSRC